MSTITGEITREGLRLIAPSYDEVERACATSHPYTTASTVRTIEVTAKVIQDLNQEQVVDSRLLDLANLDNLETGAFSIRELTVVNMPAPCLERVKFFRKPIMYALLSLSSLAATAGIDYGCSNTSSADGCRLSKTLSIASSALLYLGIGFLLVAAKSLHDIVSTRTRTFPITV